MSTDLITVEKFIDWWNGNDKHIYYDEGGLPTLCIGIDNDTLFLSLLNEERLVLNHSNKNIPLMLFTLDNLDTEEEFKEARVLITKIVNEGIPKKVKREGKIALV